VALGAASLFAALALVQPAIASGSRAYLVVTLGLGLGVVGSALLASLRGRGRAEQYAFYAFLTLSLHALGQVMAPGGWPVWPLFALLVGAVAVAEPLGPALGVAALAGALVAAEALHHAPPLGRTAAAGFLGLVALAFAVNRALLGEKRRLSSSLAELARIKHGIEQLDEVDARMVIQTSAAERGGLRLVSEEARRSRQMERATTLDQELTKLVGLCRQALDVHSVLYFEVSRER
jgi:hypothetical protein